MRGKKIKNESKHSKMIGFEFLVFLFLSQKFSCQNKTENYFRVDASLCPENLIAQEQETSQNHILQENGRDYKSFDDNQNRNSTDTSIESQTEAVNDIIEPARLVSPSSAEGDSTKLLLTTALSTRVGYSETRPPVTTARIPTIFKSTQNFSNSFPVKRFYPSSTMPNGWRLRNFSDLQQSQSSPLQTTDYYSSPGPTSMILMRDKWRNKSGCYYSCIQQARGLQTVVSKYDFSTNIQLCEPLKIVNFSFL